MVEFEAYLERHLEAWRAHMAGHADAGADGYGDVLTGLIRGENGEELTADELVQNCIFLLTAGHETTTNLIGNGIAAVLDKIGRGSCREGGWRVGEIWGVGEWLKK